MFGYILLKVIRFFDPSHALWSAVQMHPMIERTNGQPGFEV